MSNGKSRFLLVLPGAFGPAGGLEMYDRLIIKGMQEIARERAGRCETLVLLDEDKHFDARYLDPAAPPLHAFAGSRPRFAASTLERVARFRPDLIVFGHVNFSALALAVRALRPTAKQWFLTYGIDVWRRLVKVQFLAVRTAQRILSISDYTRVQLCKHNHVSPSDVELLPCALDPFWAADFAGKTGLATPDPARPLLLTVARLAESERYKGIDQVIRALPTIAKSIPGVRYAVVGTGTDRSRLEQVARDAGVASRVDFRGRVSPEALASAYAESSIFVMPSAKEGFGIVFLEAALFGKASIGGNHGGTPEVIVDGETGRLVTYDDVDAFATTAVDLLADPVRLAAMGTAAHRRLEARFTYPTFLDTLRAQVQSQLDR